jgi:signal transduction histidine kinase/ActR/RegA family two-component response regulator
VRVPVEWQGDTIGYVSLGMRQASVEDQVRQARDAAAVVSILVFLTATLAVLLVSRVVTRPLHEMVRAAQRISEGDLSERADIRSHDEVGRLAQAFNVMVARLQEAQSALEGSNRELERRVDERTQQLVESEQALRHAQKMEAVGRLAAGVAHDFNNLLTVINGHAELGLMLLAEEDPTRDSLTSIATAGASAAALTQQLLAFSRKQMLQPTDLKLDQAIGDMEQILEGLLGETVQLELRFDPHLGYVCVDRGQLQQVVMNLAVNAKDAMPAGGTLTIVAANRAVGEDAGALFEGVPAGDYVELEITDTGHGMTESVRTRAFEPFFSTKAEGKGTGLGLSTVYGIVAQSGGHLLLTSEVGRGTTFRVLLPRITPASTQLADGRDDPTAGGRERILLVEDADGVRELARRMLEREGYQVVDAACGADALGQLETARGAFDLVLTDVVMPRMNGRELAEEVGRRYPDIALVYMSGYTDDEVVLGGVRDHDVTFIEKPFSRRTLLDAVREALDERRPAAA